MQNSFSKILLSLFFLFLASGAHAQKVALVIGNSQYGNVPALENPVNDAALIARTFQELGFEVIEAYDQDEAEFANTLFTFATKINGADVAAFYYAGHALQFEGANYLISTDALLGNPFAFHFETTSLDLIIKTMESNADVSLVFLDSCRVNPFLTELQRDGVESVQAGLASVEVGTAETIVMFAAALNGVAVDGLGDNSPFAIALARHLPAADTEFGLLMRRVIRDVRDMTGNLQSPELLMATSVEVYLNMSDDMLSRGSITSNSIGPELSVSEAQRQIEELWSAGFILSREGLDQASYALFDSAQKLAAAKFGEDSELYGQSNNHLIGALTGLNRIEDAIYAAREAIRVQTIHNGANSIPVANDRGNLASRLLRVGNIDEARTEFLGSIAIFETQVQQLDDYRLFASAMVGYSELLSQEGNLGAALEMSRQALTTYERSGLTHQIDYGWMLSNVAYMERHAGNCDQAHVLFQRSVDAFEDAGVSVSQRDHANSIAMVIGSC